MSMTNETAAKISATKNQDSRKEVLGHIKKCDAAQEEADLAVPTHRKKKHLSFDEYKAMIKSGMTPGQIIEGTSKHVVYFYNTMLAGKITLGKEEFEREYSAGTSLDDLAAKHNLSRASVGYLREFYGIKRKGATFQKRLAEEKPLSEEAKSIIIGSILGDGHIHPLGYWSEKHCIAQADYLRWKASFVPDITTEKSFDEYENHDKRYGHTNKGLSFRTRAHSWLYELGNMFYHNDGGKREKIIPANIAELLNERALAVWFMDDGHTDWGYRNGIKEYANTLPTCTFHTESFSFGDVRRLCDGLRSKYGLICNPRQKDSTARKHQWVIRIDSESSKKMLAMLADLSVPCMRYKFYDKNL